MLRRKSRGPSAIAASSKSFSIHVKVGTQYLLNKDLGNTHHTESHPEMSESNDRVLAKPAGLCCLKGSIHSGEPQGRTEQIDGVETYIATPDPKTANGNVLLFFPDAFGLYVNSHLMMDAFASCGYLTLGVDYFLGVKQKASLQPQHLLTIMQDPVWKHTWSPLTDTSFNFNAWKEKHFKNSEEVASKWTATVKSRYGTSEDVKFACVGYWSV